MVTDHGARWLVNRRAVQAELQGDTLCVNVRGRITPWRLRIIAAAVTRAMEPHDCGAVMVSVITAQLDMDPEALAWLWARPDAYPLAARFVGVLFDTRRGRTKWLLRSAANLLASRFPGHLLELFDMGNFKAAAHWADRHAVLFRQVQAEKEARAVHRGKSASTPRRRRT
jgi:hypothetical protein